MQIPSSNHDKEDQSGGKSMIRNSLVVGVTSDGQFTLNGESAALSDVLEQLNNGSAQSVVITGPPGMAQITKVAMGNAVAVTIN